MLANKLLLFKNTKINSTVRTHKKDTCINVRVYASYTWHTKLIHFLSVLQLKDNPFHYDSHLQLIELLRQLGDLDRARQARQNMSNNFPLSEGIQNTHPSHPHPHTPHTLTAHTHLNYLLLLLTPLTPSHLTHPHRAVATVDTRWAPPVLSTRGCSATQDPLWDSCRGLSL